MSTNINNVSQIFGEITEAMMKQFTELISPIRDDIKKIENDISGIHDRLLKIEKDMHKTPCMSSQKHYIEHQKQRETEQKRILMQKKFIYNIMTIVVATGIIAIFGGLIYAFRHGY